MNFVHDLATLVELYYFDDHYLSKHGTHAHSVLMRCNLKAVHAILKLYAFQFASLSPPKTIKTRSFKYQLITFDLFDKMAPVMTCHTRFVQDSQGAWVTKEDAFLNITLWFNPNSNMTMADVVAAIERDVGPDPMSMQHIG